MRTTGYDANRAAPSTAAEIAVADDLARRGYGPVEQLPVDGHRPDLRLSNGDYVDVKTGAPNMTIELNSLHEYQRIEFEEKCRVYVVHASESEPWMVDTPSSAVARIQGGPHRRSGSGSNDDWYLIRRGGTPFDKFFPAPEQPKSGRCQTWTECDDNPFMHCTVCWKHLKGFYESCPDHGFA